jgi:hypothetical protein
MALLPPVTLYLSGVRNASTDIVVNDNDEVPLGLLIQPLTENYLRPWANSQGHLVGAGVYSWAGIDNGCFTEVGRAKFRLDKYLDLSRRALDIWGDNLLFVTAPDEPFDWEGTLRKSLPVLPAIREACPDRAALVLQDGATIENIPWDEADALFIGGSTEWKVGSVARSITKEANHRRKWVHMGRVNSAHRMSVAASFEVGSVDGTYLLHATDLAKAVLAVSWLVCPRDTNPPLRDLLQALRNPSPSIRAAATRSLLSRAKPQHLVEALAQARAADAIGQYERIYTAAAFALARKDGRDPQITLREVNKIGEMLAVDDILEWLRTLYRATPLERRARSQSEYGSLLSQERPR